MAACVTSTALTSHRHAPAVAAVVATRMMTLPEVSHRLDSMSLPIAAVAWNAVNKPLEQAVKSFFALRI